MSDQLYLILHRVRGEPAFDIAQKLEITPRTPGPIVGSEEVWIIPTSGHRAYPYRRWPLEDLADISDINMSGHHDRPASFDHTVPDDWPDHYQLVEPKRPPLDQIKYDDKALIEFIAKQMESQ